jgi:SAM-dependent methyltransferase
MQYPDAANRDLVVRIPLTARTVLDVGCGTAATGLEYKRLNPAVRYFGVDRDADSCAVAAGRIDHVVCADIEALPQPFGDQRFDCIVYGDVLEQLRDPWAILRQHAALLAPGGVVVVCMPNIEHWSFVHRLLTGGWDYEATGLFDVGHLRWFNGRTTHAALAASGLTPLDVKGRVFDAGNCEAFIAAMAPALQAIGVDPADYQRRASPMQHVWRAVQAPVERLNIVSTMLDPVGGVSHLRVEQPMRALSSLPELFTLVLSGPEMPRLAPDSPKIFIFHRPLLLGDEGLRTIRQLIALGFVVVCEFDDNPDFLPVLQRPDVQNFRAVHAIQTSTAPLAEVLVRHNPEVAVFPNAIERVVPPRNFANPDAITLFFGGINREDDWREWVDALNEAAEQAGPRLRFHIVHDEALFNALTSPHKRFTPLCGYAEYLDLLQQCEVSFMPLCDNAFNRCKSDLKFLEAAQGRVVALASPTVYAETIDDGRTGLIFRTAEELKRHILGLIDNRDAARAMADAALAYVISQRMQAYQLADRLAWYRSLWARRDALNRALLARVPELAEIEEPIAPPASAEAAPAET